MLNEENVNPEKDMMQSIEENANPSAKVVGTASTISSLVMTVVLQNRRSSHTNND